MVKHQHGGIIVRILEYMKTINNYIQEKLHIGQSTKTNLSFSKGDMMGCIILTNNNPTSIWAINPIIFIKLDSKNESIIFRNMGHKTDYAINNVYVNSNGYYEGTCINDSGIVVCLTPDTILDIFKIWNSKNLNKILYNNYFDKSDEFLNKNDFEYSCFQDPIDKLIEKYKNKKED